MRIYELAKDLDIPSKELLELAQDLGIDAGNHMCALTEDQVALLRHEMGVTDEPLPPGALEALRAEEEKMEAERQARADAALEAEKAAAEEITETQPSPEPEASEPEPEPEDEGHGEEKSVPGKLIVKGPMVVKEFASEVGLKPNQIIATLMTMNVFASINQTIDVKTMQKLGEKHGVKVEQEKKAPEPKPPPPPKKKKEVKPPPEPDQPDELLSSPPIVTFLGHVDHGKTSLLDKIRDSRVAAGEDGGITQHIGAYTVEYGDQKITFLDTPGHEAFTAMRARGANLTDIAVLIVAADDGIMPQTKEAIQHAQAAGVTIIVAINKMDLPGANPDRVKQQLQQYGLMTEDWGGDIGVCEVSAMTGDGIDDLLSRIVLESEMLELKANPRRKAQGYVIEARMEPGMGPTANILIRKGTLKLGDAVACGSTYGRIKALINDKGVKVRTAGPSSAVKCMGLTSVPEAGAEFFVCDNDREARSIAEEKQSEERQTDLTVSRKVSLDSLFDETAAAQVSELPIVLKSDVKGSLEAIEQSLLGIKSDKVTSKLILTGVGNITENDVLLASASNAVIIGFHVGLESGVRKAAKHEGVEIRLYSVIYELLDDVREAMTGLLEPEYKEKILGHAEVLQVFTMGKRNKVAGCIVRDGRVSSKAKIRVTRDGELIYEGSLASLRRFQNDANEIREGQECGMRLDNFGDLKPGDMFEAYDVEKIAQEL